MIRLISTLVFTVYFSLSASAQIGFRIGYAHPYSLTGDINFHANKNVYHLGGTYQFSGQLGQSKDDQLPNYGRTSLGGDSYLVLFDLGYSRWLTKRLAIGAEASIGSQRYFTNYSDKRFKAGGYHLITGSQFMAGLGGKATYRVWQGFSLFAGYNMISGVNGGIGWMPRGDLDK